MSDLREQVLTASVTLIGEAGLQGLSMREVARRAGVSHQAPYHHFADKEAIVAALVERGFTRLAEQMEAAAAARAPVSRRLKAVGQAYVQFALAEPVYFRLMFRPELVDLGRFPEAEAAGTRAFAVLQALVDEQLAGRRLGPARRTAYVSMHWAMVHGVAALALDGALGRKLADPLPHLVQVLELFAELTHPADR